MNVEDEKALRLVIFAGALLAIAARKETLVTDGGHARVGFECVMEAEAIAHAVAAEAKRLESRGEAS